MRHQTSFTERLGTTEALGTAETVRQSAEWREWKAFTFRKPRWHDVAAKTILKRGDFWSTRALPARAGSSMIGGLVDYNTWKLSFAVP